MTTEAQQATLQRLHDVVTPILDDLELELVELIYRPEQHGWVVRIIIYKPDGIGVDDCARVSREVSTILDVEDFIPHHYTLEVSSPGLDRPLKTVRDFERNLGSRVAVTLSEDGEISHRQGAIARVENDQITVETNKGTLIFPIDRLKKAKLII